MRNHFDRNLSCKQTFKRNKRSNSTSQDDTLQEEDIEENIEKKCVCTACNKSFNRKSSYVRHKKFFCGKDTSSGKLRLTQTLINLFLHYQKLFKYNRWVQSLKESALFFTIFHPILPF